MSSSESSEANTPPSRAYTIWTGKRPVIRPLTKPGQAGEDSDTDAAEPASTPPSHAFTVWIKTPRSAADGEAAAGADEVAEPESEPEKAAGGVPGQAFSVWSNPSPAVAAATAALASPEAEAGEEESSEAGDEAAAGSAPIPPAPSTTPPEPERGGGGGGGLLGVGAAALVALVFGVLGYGVREDLKKLEQSNGKLQEQLAAAAEENEQLDAALAKGLSAADRKLSGQVSALRSEKAELEKNLAAADKKLSDRVGALNADKEELAAGLAAAEKDLADQVTKFTEEKAALQKKLAEADKKLADQVAALSTGKANLEKKVAGQIDDLDAAKKDLQMRLMAEKTRIEGLMKNVQTLQGEFAKEKTSSKQEFTKLRGQLDSAKTSIDRLIKALSGLGRPVSG